MTDTRLPARAEAAVIEGPGGPLEATLDLPEGEPGAVAVLCHPHPRMEGTMHNKVVATLARTAARAGAAAVRFNFRGVGASAGRYDEGRGERDDAVAAVAFAVARWPGRPLWLGGFSFGGAIALAVAPAVRPELVVVAAPAVGRLPQTVVAPACPWLLVHGAADAVVLPAEVEAWVKAAGAAPELVVLPGVGHFFHGALKTLGDAVAAFLERQRGGGVAA